ncbi:hypothetical protein [Lysobacter firmicutimachus]|uniref:VRR-NUC domain-containing protein n=1 Tax=Lysobacter firmicutimachus TaxID=1792846 RepID=A0ABU8CYI2_9GAMM
MRAQRRYGSSLIRKIESTDQVKRERAKRRDVEAMHGRALVRWANLMAVAGRPELAFLLHVPNGGARSASTGAELKRQGVRRGVWDYFLPMQRRPDEAMPYAGLWIELKEPSERRSIRGGLSPQQMAFGRFVHGHGFATVVAYEWTEARDALAAYLDAQVVPFFWCPLGTENLT